MARRVFFSFHYERDIWRAEIVRNSWVTKPGREAAGFLDDAEREKLKRQGKEVVKRWIDKQLEGTSVTAVLIGAETSSREWVKYEIEKSYERGNGLLGIYIHNIKDKDGNTDTKGNNPFDNISQDGKKEYLSKIYITYDWVNDDGYNNFGKWVERAALKAGR